MTRYLYMYNIKLLQETIKVLNANQSIYNNIGYEKKTRREYSTQSFVYLTRYIPIIMDLLNSNIDLFLEKHIIYTLCIRSVSLLGPRFVLCFVQNKYIFDWNRLWIQLDNRRRSQTSWNAFRGKT